MRFDLRPGRIVFWAALLAGLNQAAAQTNFSIYSDQLNNGFQNWSWNPGDNNFANSSPVHSGSDSIAFTGGAWEGLSFAHSDFNPAPYTNLNFWINSGAGGQIIQIYAQYGVSSAAAYQLPALPATTNWQHYFIPFSALNAVGVTNLNRITFQLTSFGTANPFYLDDVNLTAIPPPLVHLGINTTRTVRQADARWFGLNTAVWDNNFDTPTTSAALAALGTKILRFPGGSLSDTYHWTSNSSWDGQKKVWTKWGTSFTSFIHIATNVGAQAIITVNYGMGTSNEAAAWVKSANLTNHLGFKYWEIGNECYGTWETDSNTTAHDPYTYALRAAQYLTAMKAADPADNIKIGVVAAPGEGSYSNNASHFAINPRTGTTNYGWTPIMLSTLKTLGVTPDFLVHHVYPEYLVDADQALLQASGNWVLDAADLRQQITDYMGSTGTNVELLCTENNSDSGNQGKQSTSIVNGLYLADSLAQLMTTEFNSLVWWDLRNGTDTTGDFDPSLYGWRSNGDLGIIGNLNTYYPAFFTYKLMQYFAQPGDTVLRASSDYTLLPAYATRKANGSLAILVVNKDNATVFTPQLSLANYLPWTNATVRSFGIAQDEATRTNSIVPGAKDIVTNNLAINGTNFSAVFPPYSLTLLTIPPAAPVITVLPSDAGQIALQVHGQSNVSYVVQSSTDLTSWTSTATNILSGTNWNVTNNISGPVNFWRAVWLP